MTFSVNDNFLFLNKCNLMLTYFKIFDFDCIILSLWPVTIKYNIKNKSNWYTKKESNEIELVILHRE